MSKRTCSVEGCLAPHHARGFCQSHHNKWRRCGDPAGTPRKVGRPPCSVDGCANDSDAHGLCSAHHRRLSVHGDVLAHVPLQKKRPRGSEGCSAPGCRLPFSAKGLCKKHYTQARIAEMNEQPCVITGCERPRHSATHGWCEAHHHRWLEYGDPLAGPEMRSQRSPNSRPSNNTPEYRLYHRRVRAARGPAWKLRCTDCGEAARDWATIHGRTGESPDDFLPMCRSCHFRYDGVGGHAQPLVGEACSFSKLTEGIVREIRSRHAEGESPGRMASEYGVHRDSIKNVINFRTWKHVA